VAFDLTTHPTVRITKDEIDVGEVLDAVRDDKAGAIALFLGTVRDHSEAGSVDRIAYESYAPMAEKRMREIGEEVFSLWAIAKIAMVHRVGELRLGETSVAVAVSSEHRAEAFDACRHAIERIKHDVPIWKKERLTDGKDHWVSGRKMVDSIKDPTRLSPRDGRER
jgi:molybdopterin synthase catalytic subunit